MKRLIGALVAAAMLATSASAQVREVTQFPLAIDYDLDSTSYVYAHSQGVLLTTGGATTRAEGVLDTIKSNIRVTTAGSSTTITALVASSTPFNALQAGDFIRFRIPTGNNTPDVADALEREDTPWLKVVTRTSANQISVNQAVDLTAGTSFEWRRALVGTQVGYGWIPVRGFDSAKFSFAINQANTTTGIDMRVECRDDIPGLETDSIFIVYPYDGAACGFGSLSTDECTFTATSGTSAKIAVDVDTRAWYECRIGYKLDTTDDGNDLTTNLEEIRVDVTLVKGF